MCWLVTDLAALHWVHTNHTMDLVMHSEWVTPFEGITRQLNPCPFIAVFTGL